jgi:hypothetical protein
VGWRTRLTTAKLNDNFNFPANFFKTCQSFGIYQLKPNQPSEFSRRVSLVNVCIEKMWPKKGRKLKELLTKIPAFIGKR